MKSILMSIRPKWCELIANGKKTVEVRKTQPKLETPFKVYIYCTNSKDMLWILRENERDGKKISSIVTAKDCGGATKGNGKVIGEFVCRRIDVYPYNKNGYGIAQEHLLLTLSCLGEHELYHYLQGKKPYAWNISDLVIYDKPKELWDFVKPGYPTMEQLDEEICSYCYRTEYGEKKSYSYPGGYISCEGSYCPEAYDDYLEDRWTLNRAPQSWCYVEEVKDNG